METDMAYFTPPALGTVEREERTLPIQLLQATGDQRTVWVVGLGPVWHQQPQKTSKYIKDELL